MFLKVLGISGPMNTNFLPFCLILGFNKLIILGADWQSSLPLKYLCEPTFDERNALVLYIDN